MPAWAAFGVKSSTSVTGRAAPESPPPPQPVRASTASATDGRRARRMAEQAMRTGRGTAFRAVQANGGALEASEAKEPDEKRTVGDEVAEEAAASTLAEVIPARGPAAYVAEFIGTFT